MRTKYFSLDRVAKLRQRGRARLGQGLDKLISSLCGKEEEYPFRFLRAYDYTSCMQMHASLFSEIKLRFQRGSCPTKS